jgi:hypothetical protein
MLMGLLCRLIHRWALPPVSTAVQAQMYVLCALIALNHIDHSFQGISANPLRAGLGASNTVVDSVGAGVQFGSDSDVSQNVCTNAQTAACVVLICVGCCGLHPRR